MKIFWSYAKLDNKKPHKLSTLRDAFNTTLDQTCGFENQIVVDESALKWGMKWKAAIERLIRESDALIAVLSPSYFNSRMCIHELDLAMSASKVILPLYYRHCPKGLKSGFKTNGNEANLALNAASKKIQDIQYKDFRKLRNKDVQSEVVQDFLDKMAECLS